MRAIGKCSVALNQIKALALDVDGTLTDGGLWWGPDGEEMKRFSYSDIMGVSLLRRSGFLIALISGEDSPLVDRYAAKLLIEDVTRGCRDKAAALRAFATKHDLKLSEICFMGDDVNDMPAMELAGLSAAPSDARKEVLEVAGVVCSNRGGHGAVREIADTLLNSRGLTASEVFRAK
jgi:3-deoxy-D-manno-octulosonate 8-phosphate phosphatase (KDO 8-P phosphatase)